MDTVKSKRKNEKRSRRGGFTATVPYSMQECRQRIHQAFIEPTWQVTIKQNSFHIVQHIHKPDIWLEGVLHSESDQTTQMVLHVIYDWGTTVLGGALGLAFIVGSSLLEGDQVGSLLPMLFGVFMTVLAGWLWFNGNKRKFALRDILLQALDIFPDANDRPPMRFHLIGRIFVRTSPLWTGLAIGLALIGVNKLLAVVWMFLVGVGFAGYSLGMLYVTDYVVYRQVGHGQYDRALKSVKWLTLLNPFFGFRSSTYLHEQADLLFRAGRYDEAARVIDRVLNSIPQQNRDTSVLVHLLIAEIQFANSEEVKTRRHFELAIAGRMAMYSSLVWPAVAWWYLETGCPAEALQALDRAQKMMNYWLNRLMPQYRPQLIQAGSAWAYAQQGHEESARRILADALQPTRERYDPGEAALHYYAARTMYLLGEANRARDHLKIALKLDPHGHIGNLARRHLAELDHVAA